MTNQNELTFKNEVFVLGNIYKSPGFNEDRISGMYFQILFQKECQPSEMLYDKGKKYGNGTILAIKYLLLNMMIC